MKKNYLRILYPVLLILILILMLYHSDYVIQGVHAGLELWYSSVLPSIFPFMVITSLLLHHVQGSGLCYLGLLCGLPVGANLVNQQYKTHSISKQKANVLLCCCNITSPMFICGYIWNQGLLKEFPLIPFLCAIYIPVAGYALVSFLRFRGTKETVSQPSNADSLHTKSDSSIEAILLQCLKVILLAGIYIMFFCILLQFLFANIPEAWEHVRLATSYLEITNGIQTIHHMTLPLYKKTALMASLTSFGGICSILQTKSVITESELSLCHYIWIKLIFGFTSYWLIILFHSLSQ